MKRLYFLGLVLVVIIVVSLSVFFRVINDNEDLIFDPLFNSSDLLCAYLLFVLLFNSGIFRIFDNDFICLEPFVSFLARKEKSPPVLYL